MFVFFSADQEEEEVVLKVDSTSSGFSILDELPSNMSIPSSEKFNSDEKCLRQSLKETTSLIEDENGKKECSFVDSTESGEKRCSKRFKATASLEEKRKKDKNMSSFIGDPIPDDEAQERWRWRYEMKVIIEFLFALILLDQLALNLYLSFTDGYIYLSVLPLFGCCLYVLWLYSNTRYFKFRSFAFYIFQIVSKLFQIC